MTKFQVNVCIIHIVYGKEGHLTDLCLPQDLQYLFGTVPRDHHVLLCCLLS